jgi:hypothetical protein
VTYRVHLRSGERVLVREPLPDGAPAWVTGDELGVEVAEVACRLLTS